MKCPYCGVYYMDDEHECPICGKRPGLLAPKDKPVSDKKPADSSEASGQQAELPDNKQKKPNPPGCTSGCLTMIVIVFILFTLCIALAFFLNSDELTTSTPEPMYQSYELTYVIPAGTWTDTTLLLTIYEDGSIEWVDGSDSAMDDFPDFRQISEYDLLNAELERYPPELYTYYELYYSDPYSTLPEYHFHLFIPSDITSDELTSFDSYNCNNDLFSTFTRIDSQDISSTPVTQYA